MTIIINESGLYSLILSSKLESARRFKRWVTSEVLPAIRQNGRYELQQQVFEVEEQNRALESRNAYLEDISAYQKPLTDYARIILSSTQTVTVTQIAQDYGFTAVRFNELLMHLRIQHKVGGQWILYAPMCTVAMYRVSRRTSCRRTARCRSRSTPDGHKADGCSCTRN